MNPVFTLLGTGSTCHILVPMLLPIFHLFCMRYNTRCLLWFQYSTLCNVWSPLGTRRCTNHSPLVFLHNRECLVNSLFNSLQALLCLTSLDSVHPSFLPLEMSHIAYPTWTSWIPWCGSMTSPPPATSPTAHFPYALMVDKPIVAWNVRGLGTPLKRGMVNSLLQKYHPAIIGLQETHLTGDSLCCLRYSWVGHAYHSTRIFFQGCECLGRFSRTSLYSGH